MVRLGVVLTVTQITEEPDEVKVSRPVLEARQVGDYLTLASEGQCLLNKYCIHNLD